MKTRSFLFVAFLVLVLAVSACAPTAQGAAGQAASRTVVVSGTGTVTLQPDIAYIYIGVHTEKDTPSQAVAENNAQTQGVIDALKEFGVAANDIRTSNFSIWPVDKYDPATGQPSGLKMYAVDNTVYVTVRDLNKLGSLLDRVITAGANTVNSIQFDVANKDEVLKQARADAVKNAKSQAQELADAAGVQLGALQSISYADNPVFPIFDGRGGGGGAAQAAVPIQPGQMTLSVTVTLTYEIK
jgi:hypothetical protein